MLSWTLETPCRRHDLCHNPTSPKAARRGAFLRRHVRTSASTLEQRRPDRASLAGSRVRIRCPLRDRPSRHSDHRLS
jgi:hypothetical protein